MMNVKDYMGDAFLKVVLKEAISQGYSMQDIEKLYNDVDKEKDEIYWGHHGTCRWNINNSGILTIEPQNGKIGELRDQSLLEYKSPWEDCAKNIVKVVIKDGVVASKDSAYLFAELKNCREMDLSGLDTSKVQDMDSMFMNCKNLESLDFKNFDTRETINMAEMFQNCSSMKFLNITSFDTTKVEDMDKMFNNCSSLENIFHGDKFKCDNASRAYMFFGCDKLKITTPTLENLLFVPEKFAKAWEPQKSKPQENSKEYNEPTR